jgi:P22 coat protein - gene protein 5
MAVVVDQAKLILNSFAAIFENNLIAKDLVTWKKHDGEMNDRNGLTVVENIGPRFITTKTVSAVQDLTAGVQDMVYGSEQYRLLNLYSTSMGVGDFNKIRDMSEAKDSEALRNAALDMAHTVDGDILRFATLASSNWTGTPGTVVDSFDDVASGYTRLKEEGVNDADLRAVLNYSDRQALGSNIVTNNASLPGIADGVYRQGFTGDVAGFPTMFTQQLPTVTAGTRTNGAVNGAGQGANYSAVSISPAPGQYMSQTIAADGFGAAATIPDGETFTIAGVFAYDNRLKASLGRLQEFRVIGDTVADGTGAVAALRIFPAIIVPAAGTTGTNAVNSANATVTAVPADNAVITWRLTPGQVVRPRLFMNKGAVICNTMDLSMPSTGTSRRQSLAGLPISIRIWKDSVFATGEHRVRFDLCLTPNIVDRRRLVRING